MNYMPLRIPKPFHNTPLRVLYKVDYFVALNRGVKFCVDDIDGLANIVFFEEYYAVNFLYLVNSACGKAPATKAYRVDTDVGYRFAAGFGKWGNILTYQRAA